MPLYLSMQELDLEIQQERQRQRQRAKEAEALTKRTHACSYCGEVGHNKRGCPKLAREQQKEEDKRSKEQYGPLWGLAGVEEQRMPRGQQALLVFPVPFRIEDAVNQVGSHPTTSLPSQDTLHCFPILSNTTACYAQSVQLDLL